MQAEDGHLLSPRSTPWNKPPPRGPHEEPALLTPCLGLLASRAERRLSRTVRVAQHMALCYSCPTKLIGERGWALLKDSPRRERRRVTCNHVRFTCSLAHPEAPGTSDKQVPEEGGILPLPDPGFLRGICTAETTFLQQRSSGGVQGRTSQLCPAWGGSGDPDVELGSFSKLEKVINEVWPLPAPYVLF